MSNIYATTSVGDTFIRSGFPYLVAAITPEGNITQLLMANVAPSFFRGQELLHRHVLCHSPGHAAGNIRSATPATNSCTLTTGTGLNLIVSDFIEIYQDDGNSWYEITDLADIDGLTVITSAKIRQPLWHYDPTTGNTERIQ